MDPLTPPSPSYRIFRDHHGIPQFEPKRGTQALKDALIYSFPALETELQLMQAALRKFFDSERGSTFVFELPERDLQASLAKKRDIPVSPTLSGKASLRSWTVSRASRTPSRPSSRASSRAPSRSRTSSRCQTPTSFQDSPGLVNGGTMTTWVLSNGQELEKRKRQPYDPVKRRKVAENRGNACEKHRASKTAVSDPVRLQIDSSDGTKCNANECPQNKLYSKVVGQARRDSDSTAYESPNENLSFQTTSNTQAPTDTPWAEQLDAEDIATQLDSDVFFDASDLSTIESSLQGSFVGLNHPSTSSNSTTWTDGLELGAMSWNSSDLCTPISETIMESTSPAQNMEGVESQVPVHGEHSFLQDGFATQNLQAVPEENFSADHGALLNADPTSLDQHNSTMHASDDPFMGWASKRASHLFDDYGWVLSHVEAL